MTKAGGYRGIDPDGVAETEADHFGSCPICGALLDMRDLTQRRRSGAARDGPLL